MALSLFPRCPTCLDVCAYMAVRECVGVNPVRMALRRINKHQEHVQDLTQWMRTLWITGLVLLWNRIYFKLAETQIHISRMNHTYVYESVDIYAY